MAVPEDFIIDCSEVPSVERAEREIFAVDFRTDGYIPPNSETEFVDWCGVIGKMDVDLPSPKSGPEAGILGHSLSGPIDWTNSREEFEWDLLSIDLDPDVESAGKPHAKVESRSARPSAFFTSALVHVAFFWALVFIPASQVAGTFGYAGNVLTATILSHEDLIPQDESPASVDSPASAPSIAKASKKPKEPESTEQPKESHDRFAALEKEPEKEIINEKEDPRGDGPQNSLASMPSTASAERRFVPAAGQGGEAFDSLVLSAIREAIFFPKQAVQERRHGEVTVAFSINKDRSISNLSIAKSSGVTILDEAAIKIVQKAAKKFPPFPDSLSTDALHFVVPILFKEKGK